MKESAKSVAKENVFVRMKDSVKILISQYGAVTEFCTEASVMQMLQYARHPLKKNSTSVTEHVKVCTL